jgi:hypothetical protein
MVFCGPRCHDERISRALVNKDHEALAESDSNRKIAVRGWIPSIVSQGWKCLKQGQNQAEGRAKTSTQALTPSTCKHYPCPQELTPAHRDSFWQAACWARRLVASLVFAAYCVLRTGMQNMGPWGRSGKSSTSSTSDVVPPSRANRFRNIPRCFAKASGERREQRA